VKAVDPGHNTITFDDRARAGVAGKTFALAGDANVVIDGKPGQLADLPAGSYVDLFLRVDRQTVGALRARGPTVHGVVKAVEAGKNVITVDGNTSPVANDANIVIEGKTLKLAGVPAGVRVSVKLCVDRKTVRKISQTKAP